MMSALQQCCLAIESHELSWQVQTDVLHTTLVLEKQPLFSEEINPRSC